MNIQSLEAFEHRPAAWATGALLALVLAALLGLEWLFQITKPSFFTAIPWSGRVVSLALSLVLLALLPGVVCAVVLRAGAAVLRPWRGLLAVQEMLRCTVTFVTALFLAMLLLLLIDNFSYTVWQFGIQKASGGQRHAYGLVFAALVLICFILLAGWLRRLLRYRWLPRAMLVGGGLVMAGLLTVAIHLALTPSARGAAPDNGGHTPGFLPNIILFGMDGVAAERMSAFGYGRATTPFLETFQQQTLRFNHQYTNAATSAGSNVSMLTGKYPTTTRLVYPPDILLGRHAWEHLPGILKNLGYRNADISVRHYVDPFDLNMRWAFDWSNGREIEPGPLQHWIGQARTTSMMALLYFVESVVSRMTQRYQHIYFIRPMPDPFAEVTSVTKRFTSDAVRMEQLKAFIERPSAQPFFANVHLMGAHGSKFRIEQPLFSAGQSQDKPWMDDFYDDAILEFDRAIEDLVSWLEQKSLMDQTLLIITSDHGQRHSILQSLPLFIRFPGATRTGQVEGVSQRLDIAPTILDYLGQTPPGWMEGASVLGQEQLAESRPVFVARSRKVEARDGFLETVAPVPPYYSLGSVAVRQCHKLLQINLDTAAEEWLPNLMEKRCDVEEAWTRDQAREALHEHLRERNYPAPAAR